MSRSRRRVSDGGLQVLKQLAQLQPGSLDWAQLGEDVGQSPKRLASTLLALERRQLIRTRTGSVFLTREARALVGTPDIQKRVNPQHDHSRAQVRSTFPEDRSTSRRVDALGASL